MTLALAHDGVEGREPEARALADLLGGEEGLEEPGQGRRVHAAAGVRDREQHMLAGDRARLAGQLVVEDDVGIRHIARRVLEGAGFVVLEATNGLRALELCRSYELPIDLVLTDVVMPDMGGLELARRLKVERPDSHILYMSGYMGGVEEAGAVSGAADVLSKPFTPNELVKRVRFALRSWAVTSPD